MWAVIEAALEKPGQDVSGICHDVSHLAKLALRYAHKTELVHFSVLIAGQKHALKLHIGPGDTPDPVLTLMLPNED